MNWHSRITSLLKQLPGKRPRSTAAIYQPLLDDTALQQLQQSALASADHPFLIDTDVQQRLLGERTSSFAGSGYEFAEHRRYVSGDDVRFIDWRAMARTGKLYRKVFHEERRPQFYLLVDRRASMRFGTRTQLKVTCAVRQAIHLLYQARQQQLVTGSVILEDQAMWIKPSQGRMELHNTIQQLNSPCPPRPLSQPQVGLESVLTELAIRLTPGCIIYLISDFHDLRPALGATLYHLTQQHTLHAVHIVDPVEQTLPAVSRFRLYDEDNDTTIDINSRDSLLKQQFRQAMQVQQQQIADLLKQTGGKYQLVVTNDSANGDLHG